MRCARRFLFLGAFLLFNSISGALNSCGTEYRGSSYPVSVYNNESLKQCECGGAPKKCVRKCCAANYVLKNDMCLYHEGAVLKVPMYKKQEVEEEFLSDENFAVGMIECLPEEKIDHITITPHLYTTYAISLDYNGGLNMPFISWHFDPDEYCIEYSENFELLAFLCYDKYADDTNFGDRLSFIGMMISLPFLLATFVVYALLPTRNLHGKCLMCFVVALFCAYFTLAFSFIYTEPISIVGCKFMGMFTYFCMMGSMFWMNVMSYDICRTFSGARAYEGNKNQTKRFLMYSGYAWGMPLLFMSLIILLSNVVTPQAWYDPGFRGEECFLRDGIPEVIFFYGPLALMITANIIMFVITAYKIKKVQNETAVFRKRGSKKHSDNDDKQNFHLYIKLLFAMGLNWSVEIINWAVNLLVPNVPPAIWYFTDFCNAAYGVFIFFIFVFKKSIWKALKKRFCKDNGLQSESSPAVTETLVRK